MLFLAGAEILCAYMNNAVGIYIKGYFNLRNASGCGHNAVEVEHTEGLVVLCHFTLALENMNLNGGLTVRCGGEHLGFLCGDGGVSVDNLGEYAAEGFKTKRKRSYVKKDDALYFAGENAALNCSADGYALIRVDALEGLFAGDVLNCFLNSGDTGRTADEKDFIKVGGFKTCVGKRLVYGAHGRLNKVGGKLVELCSGDVAVKVLRTGGVGSDERQVYIGLSHAGKVDFCFFGGLFKSLHSHFIAAEVNSGFALELVCKIVDKSVVEVVAAEVVITCGCKNLLNTVAHFDDGNIEGAAAEVVNHNLLVVLFVCAVGKSRSGRLVDDTLYLKACDFACVLSRLTLRIGEVCGNGDNRFGYRLAKVGFRIGFKLLKNHCGNLLRSVAFSVNAYFVVGAHFTLDGSDGSFGVGYSLAFCSLANDTLAGFREADNGRSGARSFGVRDNNRFAAFHNGNTRVSSTKVNTNNFRHIFFLQYYKRCDNNLYKAL